MNQPQKMCIPFVCWGAHASCKIIHFWADYRFLADESHFAHPLPSECQVANMDIIDLNASISSVYWHELSTLLSDMQTGSQQPLRREDVESAFYHLHDALSHQQMLA